MNAIIVWFMIGAVFAGIELFTPAFIFVFFGVGAWAAALRAAIWPGLEQELVAFLVVSLLSLLTLRNRLVIIFQGKKISASQNAPEFIHAGRQAHITQSIVAGAEGEISMGGSFWRATSAFSLEKGQLARVVCHAPDNELLIVVEPWPAQTDLSGNP